MTAIDWAASRPVNTQQLRPLKNDARYRGRRGRTGGHGVDVAFDPVGGDRRLDTIRTLAYGGRRVIIGFTGGSIPQVPANRLLLKNIKVVGSYLGGYIKCVPDGRSRLLARIKELLRAGAIAPVVGATFPMDRGADALREMGERRARGKVVVTIDEQ
jgi:NADPH:quinone reductase